MKKILIIDDEELVLNLFKTFLEEKLKKEVLTAGDGLAGIETYQNNQQNISFVILDMTLPKIDGPEVFKRIKEINNNQKIIILSGYPIEYFLDRLCPDKNTYIYQKPTPLADLMKTLKEGVN